MKKILLVSPHFDDAVLSAGQYMADRPDCEVVTVYGGEPAHGDKVSTPYDLKCGFKNAKDAVSVRTRENDAALALLEATAINLDFPDSQYENGFANVVTVDMIREALQELVDETYYEFIMAPLGLGHPDHEKVTEAVTQLKFKRAIYLWEDIPLRIVEPEKVPPRLQKYDLKLFQLMQPATTDTNVTKKIRAMLCYKSQINTGILDPYLMYVPERFWKYRDFQ